MEGPERGPHGREEGGGCRAGECDQRVSRGPLARETKYATIPADRRQASALTCEATARCLAPFPPVAENVPFTRGRPLR